MYRYVTPIKLGLLPKTNQIASSKGASHAKRFEICLDLIIALCKIGGGIQLLDLFHNFS